MDAILFLELTTKWAAPQRLEELWKALPVVQFPPARDATTAEEQRMPVMHPMIQVLWQAVQKQDLYFVRLHPGLAFGKYWLAQGTVESSHGRG